MNEPATSAPPSGPLPRLEALEAEIEARICEFDLTALLNLLATLGYGADDIVFRGLLTSGPRPSLLHAIAFPRRDRGARGRLEVVVTVNLGLVSCRSPLPSYFHRFLSDLDTREPVLELLELLDRSLLHERLTHDRPGRMLPTWPETQRDFLRIFGLDSPLGMRWLFRQVFPELGVRVRRIGDAHSIPYQGARLGESKLGACSFGDRTRVGVHDMEITLLCEDAIYQAGVPWLREGARRLRTTVFPVLDEICMTLTVAFVLLDPGEGARIGPPSAAGYDPMLRPGVLLQLPPARIEHRLRPRVSALLRATGRRISSAGTVASFRLRPIGDAGLTIAVAMAIARAIVHAAPGARDTFSGARTIPDELGLYDAHLARRRGGAACVDTSPRPFGGLDEGARR